MGVGFFKGLAMPGNFTIDIYGEDIEEGGEEKFENKIRTSLQIFAPGYRLDKFIFAGRNFRYEIKGVPREFAFIDNMQKAFLVAMRKYLRNWDFKLNVFYTETGGINGAGS